MLVGKATNKSRSSLAYKQRVDKVKLYTSFILSKFYIVIHLRNIHWLADTFNVYITADIVHLQCVNLNWISRPQSVGKLWKLNYFILVNLNIILVLTYSNSLVSSKISYNLCHCPVSFSFPLKHNVFKLSYYLLR